MPTQKRTEDGYSWTSSTGVERGGLRCKGVIDPKDNRTAPSGHVYDAIVIGAGYAGLIAAREMTDHGLSVLLIEARDRVGGRTYTVEEDGILYEMGGTWVTHHMAFLFKEMLRYGMDRDLILTHHSGYENDYYTIDVPGVEPRQLSHDEAGQIAARGWDIFVNVDGQNCRKICPLPHAQLNNILTDRKEVERYDKISCRERYDAIKHMLTPEEAGVLMALLLHISGGTMENSSLWDMIRSHALMSYDSANFGPIWTTFKLREGQSELALRIFQDAVEHGLQYVFQSPVLEINQRPNDQTHLAEVVTTSGAIHRARRVVSTIPLNVLRGIKFNPPLSGKRREALEIGHVNFMTKIHAEVEGPGLASWNGVKFPNLLMFGYGDGVTENGNAHIVGFGKDERLNYVPEHHPQKTIRAFKRLHPIEVKRMVFHNWVTDPWSRGGPAWWTPEYMSKYQDELQSCHGMVYFASADWANGWRAAIDGAMEQGFLAGHDIIKVVRQMSESHFTPRI